MIARVSRVWFASVVLPVLLAGCGGSGSSGGGDLAPASAGLSDAVALSNHYVEVAFAADAGDAAGDPDNYVITDPDGARLTVSAVQLSDDRTQAILTTDSQEAVEYRLTLRAPEVSTSAIADGVDPNAEVVFNGSIQLEPFVASAISLSATEILLTFSETMDAATVEDVRFYEIAAPDLAITGAVLQADGTTAILTTSTQDKVAYSVRVTNVTNKTGQLLNPFLNEADFSGIPPVDDIRPTLVRAESTSATTVLLWFSEPLADNADDPTNYRICMALDAVCAPATQLVITGVELTAENTRVVLTTLTQLAGTEYRVEVANVVDRATPPPANAIDPDHDSATFTFAGTPGVDDGTTAPRVVGAVSTSNTSVVVRFSKPMDGAAIDPSNYSIVQENVNAEVGFVAVTDAAFVDTSRVAVELTTRSQNEVTYRVTVSNVADLAGNPLAERIVSQGVLVDPTSATFAGTPPGPGELVDSDGDGLTDNIEQRGWVVTVILVDGTPSTREVTSDPGNPNLPVDHPDNLAARDTDSDGLGDQLERLLGSDPRQADTDGDSLSDDEEYNALFSNQNMVDTDEDGIDDFLEVEFFKTNALTEDSDGDGYTDGDELFTRGRDPRVADLPEHTVEIGSVVLRIDERFTFTDEDGLTTTETSSTTTSLSTGEGQTTLTTDGRTRFVNGGVELGIDSCQSDCTTPLEPIGNRFFVNGHADAGLEVIDQTDAETARAAEEAFEQSLEKGREISTTSGVTREVVGAGVFVDVTLTNPGDIAISLSNLELTLQTTDPVDATHVVPVATLLPESTLLTGEPAVFNVGPGESRGPILFASREVFPNLVEDLMKAPRGLVTRVANFDLVTADDRNFAFGLQDVRERTAGILLDFGDGNVQRFQAITAGVLDRPRDELRCAAGGDHPKELCVTDADCGTSLPCRGGTIVGGFAGFGGTGRPHGIPLDFLLEDVLQLRRTSPQTIVAGPDGVADTTAQGDDVQVLPVGTSGLMAADVVISAGRNLVLESAPGGDDLNPTPPDGTRAGADAMVNSIAQGDDVQLIPVGTLGVPEDRVAISAGENGVLDTPPSNDDVADVVTGFEVAQTCSADTPFAILAGPNTVAETVASPGTCSLAFAPSVAGQGCQVDADCGQDPASTDLGICDDDDVQVVPFNSATPSPDTVVIAAGSEGFVASVPGGDDLFLGPGVPCTADADCQASGLIGGTCAGPQKVVRVNSRRDGQFRRFWALVLPEDVQYQTDFGLLQIRAGDVIGLKFLQDVDRDGLSSEVEFLAGSSDFKRDTDDDTLDDFAEIRIGWDIGVVGSPLRRVFPDPRTPDSDADGLLDPEEFDLRPAWCACEATGPRELVGNTGTPCSSDADCGGGACLDVVSCSVAGYIDGLSCSPCSTDQTLSRTDPRLRDTDVDSVSDFEEVFGYLTGAGIMDATFAQVILAGDNRVADTLACPQNHCIEDNTQHCVSDGDCLSRQCIHPVFCDDVQVVPFGSGGWDPRTVVVAPGRLFDGVLGSHGLVGLETPALLGDVLEDLGANGIGDSRLAGDDVLFVGEGEQAFVPPMDAHECVDGSTYSLIMGNVGLAERFATCGVIKPGPDGVMQSQPSVDDVLVPAGFGQRREATDPLNPDTDMDDVRDGFERTLGASPNDPGDTGLAGDLDRDGLSDRQESSGWNVTVFPVVGNSTTRPVASNPHVPDTDLDGLPDYAERHMPCNDVPGAECPTDPTSVDTDGDGLSDLDELSVAKLEQLQALNGFFPGYFLDPTASQQLGTDPCAADSDNDGLSDHDELFQPVTVALNDGSLRVVTTDPMNPDTDQDGASDSAEIHRVAGATDPTDPDTDDDDKFDGVEINSGSDPLVPDILVTVNVQRIEVDTIEDPGGTDNGEFGWWVLLRAPSVTPNPRLLSNALDAGSEFDKFFITGSPSCYGVELEPDRHHTIELGRTYTFPLTEGESFTLDGLLAELDSGQSADCGEAPNYIPSHLNSQCYTRFAEDFSFSDLSFGERGEALAVNPVDGSAEGGDTCEWRLVISLTVQ
jgi:hypothetical protein